GSFIRLFVVAVNVQTVDNFRLLRMNRRPDRRQARGMHGARVLGYVLAEAVVGFISGSDRRLGRFEPHVVPAEILELAADLAEALRAHRRAGGAFAGEKSGRERSERLGFHRVGSLLTDDAAAEAADRTRTGGSCARRRTRRSEHSPAEILFQTV